MLSCFTSAVNLYRTCQTRGFSAFLEVYTKYHQMQQEKITWGEMCVFLAHFAHTVFVIIRKAGGSFEGLPFYESMV